MSRRTTLTVLLMTSLIAAVTGVYSGHCVTKPRTLVDTAIVMFYSSKLPDANGAPLDLVALRGQSVVINSWASWCGPYVEEIPKLSALTQGQKAKVKLVGIDINPASNIQAFLGEVYVTYPTTVAGFSGTELGHQLDNEIGGPPFTMILNARGKITFRKMGRVHTNEPHEALQHT